MGARTALGEATKTAEQMQRLGNISYQEEEEEEEEDPSPDPSDTGIIMLIIKNSNNYKLENLQAGNSLNFLLIVLQALHSHISTKTKQLFRLQLKMRTFMSEGGVSKARVENRNEHKGLLGDGGRSQPPTGQWPLPCCAKGEEAPAAPVPPIITQGQLSIITQQSPG